MMTDHSKVTESLNNWSPTDTKKLRGGNGMLWQTTCNLKVPTSCLPLRLFKSSQSEGTENSEESLFHPYLEFQMTQQDEMGQVLQKEPMGPAVKHFPYPAESETVHSPISLLEIVRKPNISAFLLNPGTRQSRMRH